MDRNVYTSISFTSILFPQKWNPSLFFKSADAPSNKNKPHHQYKLQ